MNYTLFVMLIAAAAMFGYSMFFVIRYNRYIQFKKKINLLRFGLSQKAVLQLLGSPNNKQRRQTKYGLESLWVYRTFHGHNEQAVVITFVQGKIADIDTTHSSLYR